MRTSAFGRMLPALTQLTVGVAVSLVALIPLVYATALGASRSVASLAVIELVCAAWLAFAGVFVHANQTSLHELYSARLERAYRVAARPEAHVRLSDLTLEDLKAPSVPELVVCAAVNLKASESAHGESCASFTFSPVRVGSPAFGGRLSDQYSRPNPLRSTSLSTSALERAIV